MSKIKVGIVNVTGYAGVELARLLMQHPEVELVSVTGRSAAGQKLGDVFPHLGDSDLQIKATLEKVDIAFSAMPHKESAEAIIPLVKQGTKVVDISADFRLKDAAAYPQWYGFTHPAPELLKKAAFGLPELHRAEIKKTDLVANPGCYPTSAILALAPAAKAGIIQPEIIVDSKSGVSGAGRSLSLTTHFSEVNEDVAAYALQGHRHLPEIVQELSGLRGQTLAVTFVPHLIPMTRGILTTAYATLAAAKINDKDALEKLYQDFYREEPFVRVVSAPPHTKHTRGTNLCLVYPTIDERTGRLIVVSCIDNLIKGAAGQAVQNMNLMLGLPETMGLPTLAVYP